MALVLEMVSKRVPLVRTPTLTLTRPASQAQVVAPFAPVTFWHVIVADYMCVDTPPAAVASSTPLDHIHPRSAALLV